MVQRIIRKGFNISLIDFERISKKHRIFKNAVGLYDPETDNIFVDKKLPKYNKGTMELCINHELAHARVKKVDVDEITKPGFEEVLVELEGLVRTKNSALSMAEMMLKNALTNGRRLKVSDKKQFEKIIKNICDFAGIKTDRKLIKILASGDRYA